MANIASQEKRNQRSLRERLENRRYTSTVKTYFRRLQAAVADADDEQADTEHRTLVSTIDRAVKRGALHRNAGARKKSRAARIRAAGSGSQAAAAAAARVSVRLNAVSSSRPAPPPLSSISRSANAHRARASASRSAFLAWASARLAAHGGILIACATFDSGTPASRSSAARWTSRSRRTIG